MAPQNVARFGVDPHVLKENASEQKGENARLSSFVGALAITDLVKTTLGPKGMDKILQSAGGDVQVTNDGATILKSIQIDNAAAKVLIEISKVQDDEVGDGTTSVCVLAGELLREAEKLLDARIHPQTVIAGYRIAAEAAGIALEKAAVDNGSDPEAFRNDLLNIARTTLSSKVLSQARDHFAGIAVDAVLRLRGSTNLDHIQIIKKSGGSLSDSWLEEGFILEKKLGVGQPTRVENAKILVANTAMDTDKVKIYGSRVRVDSLKRVAEIEEAEKQKMFSKCDKILGHKCNVFVNRQLIYNRPEQYFTSKGVVAIEHADFDGIERLALVTGAEIVSTFDEPGSVKLGSADLVEQAMIGEDTVIRFVGCAANEACTIVLRGANNQLLDEAERSLHDALCVLSQTVGETRTVLGGGCSETLMAHAVDEVARKTSGKKAMAVEAFARALRALPGIIASNGGYDANELVSQLRAAHMEGNHTAGLDMTRGGVADVRELGITESFKLKRQMLASAVEGAEMIIRVDDILKAAPRERNDPHPHM
ncbi:TCP-1/cpn60 chaperonin [Gracilaria domingensis]|nr:TCP-1/cpn60 chaperonin [Gracilaria domingensis]